MLSKEIYNSVLEKYIIKNFPIVQAFEGVAKHESMLAQFGYLVIFDGDHFKGIVTPIDLLKQNRKLVIDCCLPYKNFDYSSTIQDVINYIKEQNTYIIPVFRNESFYGILISIHIFEQLVSEQDELSKKIQETETEISHYKSRSLIPEQIRNELLNNISHEFRTPANAIVGFSELVCEKNMDEAKRNYFLGIIRSSGFRLLKLIDDLVELARIKAGDIEFEYSICSIDDLFTELHNELSTNTSYDTRQLSDMDVQIDPKARAYFFTTDKYRIKQVLGFLIDNAIKYSVGQRITLSCQLHDSSQLEFRVNNKGKTIPVEKLASILEGFNKFEPQDSKFQPGLGLGLAISKKVVDLMGGEFKIVSNDQEGTTVRILLPVSAM